MKTWKITWKLALLLPFFFSLSACICHKHKLNQDFISTIDKTEFLNLPESYRLIHRVRLKVRKRSFDFIGLECDYYDNSLPEAKKRACLRNK